MNTFGLGKSINAFWLGIPYLDQVSDPEIQPAGGGVVSLLIQQIRDDIRDRDYRRKEKRHGKRASEITPEKILKQVPAHKEKILEIQTTLGITKKEAKNILIQRLETEITQERINRINQLNNETLTLIMIAITADER